MFTYSMIFDGGFCHTCGFELIETLGPFQRPSCPPKNWQGCQGFPKVLSECSLWGYGLHRVSWFRA